MLFNIYKLLNYIIMKMKNKVFSQIFWFFTVIGYLIKSNFPFQGQIVQELKQINAVFITLEGKIVDLWHRNRMLQKFIILIYIFVPQIFTINVVLRDEFNSFVALITFPSEALSTNKLTPVKLFFKKNWQNICSKVAYENQIS